MSTGLVLLGWLCWQYAGTTWVARERHERIVTSLQDAWSDGADSSTTSSGEAVAVVRIPRFGVSFAVPLIDGTSDDVLALGFGRMPGSAQPGAMGNFVIAGHRITHGEPLRRMPDLRPGDLVVVEESDRILTYELDTGGDELSVPTDAQWVTMPRPRNPVPGGVEPPAGVGPRLITLVTCAELTRTDDRLVAFGHLVRVVRVVDRDAGEIRE